MTNYIIIAVLIVIAFIAIRSTVKHFSGKGGCCGGGGYKPKKKKLAQVLYTKTFTVEGMHCESCKARVEEAVNDIRGVAGRVDLKTGELTVSYAEDVDDGLIASRVERLGFTVTVYPAQNA